MPARMPPPLNGSISTRVHSVMMSWSSRERRKPRCSRAHARLRSGQPSTITGPTAVNMNIHGQEPSTCVPSLIPGQVGSSLSRVMTAHSSRHAAPSWNTWTERWLRPSGRFIWCVIMSAPIMAKQSPDRSPTIHGVWSTPPGQCSWMNHLEH
jgi:hypothetical protein